MLRRSQQVSCFTNKPAFVKAYQLQLCLKYKLFFTDCPKQNLSFLTLTSQLERHATAAKTLWLKRSSLSSGMPEVLRYKFWLRFWQPGNEKRPLFSHKSRVIRYKLSIGILGEFLQTFASTKHLVYIGLQNLGSPKTRECCSRFTETNKLSKLIW